MVVFLALSLLLPACDNGGGGGTVAGVFAIDLSTGDRTEVTAIEGTDPTPRSMAFDATGDRIFVVTSRRLIGVEAATGVQTVLADPMLGAGPDFTLLHAIAVDAAGGRAFVFDGLGVILAVDLLTGDRTLVSGGGTGTGPAFAAAPAAMVYDATGSRLIVAAPALPAQGDALVSVDPVTGNRTVLSSSAVGTGPAFAFGGALALTADIANGRVFVAQDSTVIEVALSGGNRTLLHQGPPYRSAVADDATNLRVLQVRGGVLVAIDVDTGAVTTLSDSDTGTGPAPVEPRGLEIDASRNRALVAAYVFE